MIAQDQDVAIAEISKEARSFLGLSAGALVIMVGDMADHL